MIEPYPTTTLKKLGVAALLLFAFAVIYQPWQLGGRELSGAEGFLAAQTVEMDSAMPLTTAHGCAITHTYPLYPYLVSLIDRAGFFPIEQSERILSVGMLFLTAFLVFFCAGKAGGFKAGAVAGAMYFSCAVVMEKAVIGSENTLMLFFVLSAQMVWFYCGVRYGRWNLAWILSLFLEALAFYAGGPTAFLFFLFPMLFLQRPLALPQKLAKWGLAVGLAIVGGVILSYLLPYYFMKKCMPMQANLPFYPTWGEYFWQLCVFPFAFLLRMLPWSLIMWSPFCSALAPLDSTPIFSRYLRTLAMWLFVFVWFNPLTKAADMIAVAGPLAILTGLWYEAAVRRYSVQLRQLLALCVYAVVFAALAIFVVALLPETWLAKFADLRGVTLQNKPGFQALAIGIGNALLLLAVWMNLARKKRQVWIILLATGTALAIFTWTVIQPYRCGDDSRRRIGRKLAEVMQADNAAPNLAVYKMGMPGFYSEGYYLGRPLQSIDAVEEIARNDSRVYVISEVFPQDPNRLWTNLLPKDFSYNGKRLCLWRGDLIRSRKIGRAMEKRRL